MKTRQFQQSQLCNWTQLSDSVKYIAVKLHFQWFQAVYKQELYNEFQTTLPFTKSKEPTQNFVQLRFP